MKKAVLSIVFIIVVFIGAAQTDITSSVYFEYNKYRLTSSAQKILDTVIAAIEDQEGYKISIEGNTDNSGDDDGNMRLSDNRNKSVMDYLVSKGVDEAVITPVPYGETRPKFENEAEDNRSKNRRVDIYVEFEKIVVVIDTTPAVYVEPDTIIYGAKGTELHIKAGTFAPVLTRDVRIKIEELFTTQDMIPKAYSTTSTRGDLLTTAGVITIKAVLASDTNKATTAKIPIIIKVPVTNSSISNIEEVTIWNPANAKKSFTRWKNTKTKLKSEAINGKTFLVFSSNKTGTTGLMCPAGSKIMKVKAQKYKVQSIRADYMDNATIGYFQPRGKKSFEINLLDGDSNPIITVEAKGDGKTMYGIQDKSMSEFGKKNKKIKKLKLKKKLYSEMPAQGKK